jgi:hypothetical protein
MDNPFHRYEYIRIVCLKLFKKSRTSKTEPLTSWLAFIHADRMRAVHEELRAGAVGAHGVVTTIPARDEG